MQKFKKVGIEYVLDRVLNDNTVSHQSDFDIDKRILINAMESDRQEDKHLLWLSRKHGTHCLNEREVFLKDTPAHNTWIHWAEMAKDETFKAFAIYITGSVDGRPNGTVYELDYFKHAEMVKQKSMITDTKVMVFENGDIYMKPNSEPLPSWEKTYGKHIRTEYLPEKPGVFDTMLKSVRWENERLPEGDIDEFIKSFGPQQYQAPPEFIIWSSMNNSYESAIEDMRIEYPDEPDDVLWQKYVEHNHDALDDERVMLDIQYNEPLIIIADLGLWNGRRSGYKEITSGNLKDCLYTSDSEYCKWYVDEHGDFRGDEAHHDGVNHYLYRAFKPNITEEQMEDFKDKIYRNDFTQKDIDRYTRSVGNDILKAHGMEPREPKKQSIRQKLANNKETVKKEPQKAQNKSKDIEL